MSDIYIIYARENEVIAEKLYGLLNELYEVWWDEKIVGRFAEVIEKELPNTRCVVPIFSEQSRAKDTFTDELRLALKHKKHLLPVKVDESDPPYSFGSYTSVNFAKWDGTASDRAYVQLVRKLSTVVPPRQKPKRLYSLASDRIRLPGLFFSVSSHETQLEPTDAMQALRLFGASPSLVSAFDLDNRRSQDELIGELRSYRDAGGFVLLDSGNYEASRLDDKTWTAERLAPILATDCFDWAFSFDVMEPPDDLDQAVTQILEGVADNQKMTSMPVLPIIHAPKLATGGNKLDILPEMILRVAKELEPPLLAVPERELGAGIMQRIKTTRAIRERLSSLSWYQPVHILGTGNPLSIAVLAAAGADSFDGLEWCRVAIDAEEERIYHFQHFDFFSDQTPVSPVAAALLDDSSIGFGGKVAFHNLDYLTAFTHIMQKTFEAGTEEAFLTGLLGKKYVAKLKMGVPDIFR